ncbi:MAG: hypothetical protein H7Z12_08295 [Rhodospirillaceae bacterium]|nr:hypothetical protein [Rhodospirillales bacterium]
MKRLFASILPARRQPVPVMALPRPKKRAEPILALPPPQPSPLPRHDLRRVSPRRFAEIAHELYLEGWLHWAEYQQVGFPSELHPDYDSTIGALTGEKADPDRPRDMLGEWEKRVDFMRRFSDRDVRHAERAVDILRRQAEPV